MRKRLFLGALMAMIVVLMLSCNKERFDLNHLESAQASGQWKLPLGSVDVKLGDVLKQFLQNDLISYDEHGNLQVSRSFQMNNIIKGSTFLSLGSLYFSHTLSFANPFPGLVLPEPIADSLKFQQVIEIKSDSATIESAVVKTGSLLLDMNNNNLVNIDSIVISCSGITMEDGDSLYSITHGLTHEINLAGATFRVHHENGVVDSTLVLNYAIYFSHQANDALPEQYQLTTIVGLNNLKLKEISGYIDQFSYDFSVDTSFSLPLDNVQGQLSLVGAKVKIKEKNTFENLHAHLQVDCAELYGGSAAPSQFFDHYPYVLEIDPSNTFVGIMDEQLNLTYNTEFNAIRFQGSVGLGTTGAARLVVVHDTSAVSLGVEAVVPMQFNVPEVTYVDTVDLSMESISAPEIVKEIILGIVFESKMPFRLNAQFFTYNSRTGQITGQLLSEPLVIAGCYDGNPVPSNTTVSITDEVLRRLMEADKLIMNVDVKTEDHDVFLNLENGLGVSLKADVIYDGSIDLNNY